MFPNIPSYEKIHKDKRYRVSDDSDFPTMIGGRDPQATAIAWSVYDLIRRNYPVNEVPKELISQWQEMENAAKVFERQYEAICERISADELTAIEQEK